MPNELPQAPAGFKPEYIVVGSGAGGGPLAARLAERGSTVLVLEAGGLGGGFGNYTYEVPGLHGGATEAEDMRWDFFVRHYADDARQRLDSKFEDGQNGIYYPRSSTIGGCTAHNAMITVYPHNSDWDDLATHLDDASWKAEPMRRLFERLENCGYPHRPTSRHGTKGWLSTQLADPRAALRDPQLLEVVFAAAARALVRLIGGAHEDFAGALRNFASPSEFLDFIAEDHQWFATASPKEIITRLVTSYSDPNDWRIARDSREGVFKIPLATKNGARNGSREFLLDAVRRYPGKIFIEMDALATKVVLQGRRAVGVQYLKGNRLYRADRKPTPRTGVQREALATREVILAGGTFNTPQLLMLSGIGPAAALAAHGIPIVSDRPGVGRNLQDRYEVGVGFEMTADFTVGQACKFAAPANESEAAADPCLSEWRGHRSGPYASNGAVVGIVLRSKRERLNPDLFVFGLPATFPGYYVRYSEGIAANANLFTWAILKAHTDNAAGMVELHSKDPTEPPSINFRYFDEGNDAGGEDLASVVEGVRFVRDLAASPLLVEKVKRVNFLNKKGFADVDMTDDGAIGDFVKSEAWGHHACGTCRIGKPEESDTVVDKDFKVVGVENLRVVDASVFRRIPGFFIVTPVYMIAEKAADAISPPPAAPG